MSNNTSKATRAKLPSGGVLTSAYGVTHKSRKAVVDALNARKDFTWNRMREQGYCSIDDLPDGSIEVRYGAHGYKVCMVKVNDGVAS